MVIMVSSTLAALADAGFLPLLGSRFLTWIFNVSSIVASPYPSIKKW